MVVNYHAGGLELNIETDTCFPPTMPHTSHLFILNNNSPEIMSNSLGSSVMSLNFQDDSWEPAESQQNNSSDVDIAPFASTNPVHQYIIAEGFTFVLICVQVNLFKGVHRTLRTSSQYCGQSQIAKGSARPLKWAFCKYTNEKCSI